MSKQYITKYKFGTFYYKDRGKNILHRTDGPAIEYPDGNNQWIVNGVLHRLDGPAVVYQSGIYLWYVNGEFIVETDKSDKILDRMEEE